MRQFLRLLKSRRQCNATDGAYKKRGGNREHHARDLQAALTQLGSLPGVDANRLGAVGYCLGGGLAKISALLVDGKFVSGEISGYLKPAQAFKFAGTAE